MACWWSSPPWRGWGHRSIALNACAIAIAGGFCGLLGPCLRGGCTTSQGTAAGSISQRVTGNG
eukprot:scaffold100116_cov41-Prasinocladus_malaysianus.AAC.1